MEIHKENPHICKVFAKKHGGDGCLQRLYAKKDKKNIEGLIAICPYCGEEYQIRLKKVSIEDA